MKDFSDLRNQLSHLYNEKAYAQALDLVQRHGDRFPQQAIRYHWLMCLSALLHKPTQAIQALEEALEHGYSYSALMLHDDEDLQTLQGLAAYEQLTARSEQLFAQASAQSKAELLLVEPEERHTGPAPLLLGMHGNAQNAHIAARDWRDLHKQGWLLALAHSSRLITQESYIWDDLARGAKEVQELYTTLSKEHQIDTQRTVLGGFSMGGSLAVYLALAGTLPARSFIGVGVYLPDNELLTPFLETARARGVRGYMLMGLQESLESQNIIRRTAACLNAHGIPCVLEEHEGLAHAFPSDFHASLEKALAFLFPA